MTTRAIDLDADDHTPNPWVAALMTGTDVPTLAELTERPTWHQHAACRDIGPRTFYIERGGDTRPARDLCDTCPVTEPCREAGQHERFGIWGGTTARQRQRDSRSGAA